MAEYQLRRMYDAEATGGKLYAFINRMHAENLGCWKQRCQGNVYYFRIAAKQKKRAETLAQEYGVRLKMTPRRTFGQLLRR